MMEAVSASSIVKFQEQNLYEWVSEWVWESEKWPIYSQLALVSFDPLGGAETLAG